MEKTIFDHVFHKDMFGIGPKTTVVVTEPLLNFTSIQEAMSEIFFEEYDVGALLRVNGLYIFEIISIIKVIY